MRTYDLGHHALHSYNDELEALRAAMSRMGGLVERQLERVLDCICTRDATKAEAVIGADREVNELELKIDRRCAEILARRQPMAGDLRFVIAASEGTADLERSADELERD
jgi:phosphate transport system protein